MVLYEKYPQQIFIIFIYCKTDQKILVLFQRLKSLIYSNGNYNQENLTLLKCFKILWH